MTLSTSRAVRILGFAMLACFAYAWAYDAETHGLITYKAYQESDLAETGQNSLVTRLGLNRLTPASPFHAYWLPIADDFYFDNTESYDPASYRREPNDYERCQMQHLADAGWLDGDPMLSSGGVTMSPIQNWLLRGALREDDLAPSGYWVAHEKCGQPEVDPYGGINRVMNHFYDPIHDIELQNSRERSTIKSNPVCDRKWNGGYAFHIAPACAICHIPPASRPM